MHLHDAPGALVAHAHDEHQSLPPMRMMHPAHLDVDKAAGEAECAAALLGQLHVVPRRDGAPDLEHLLAYQAVLRTGERAAGWAPGSAWRTFFAPSPQRRHGRHHASSGCAHAWPPLVRCTAARALSCIRMRAWPTSVRLTATMCSLTSPDKATSLNTFT